MKGKKIIILVVLFFATNLQSILANENGTWKIIDVGNGLNQYIYEIENNNYAKGWKEIDNNWYYFDEITGYMLQNSWVGNYYLGEDGIMLKNEWIIEKIGTTPNLIAYYVNEDGAWDTKANYEGCTGEWIKDQKGEKYIRIDGSQPKMEFEYIHNNWYFFDKDGYMITGLFYNEETGALHYFYPNGRLANNAGWVSLSDGKWVYISGNRCVVNTITPDGYLIDETGIWCE